MQKIAIPVFLKIDETIPYCVAIFKCKNITAQCSKSLYRIDLTIRDFNTRKISTAFGAISANRIGSFMFLAIFQFSIPIPLSV
jgi:hypothetical protein